MKEKTKNASRNVSRNASKNRLKNASRNTSKPKYNMAQNTWFMIRLAWTSKEKKVLVLSLLAAVLAVALNLINLYVSPVILSVVERQAGVSTLMLTILAFVLMLMVVSAAAAYVDRNTICGRISVRCELLTMLNKKAATTSYPNLFNDKYQKLSAKSQEAKNGTETYLYKDYQKDGVEVSGGEAQKIAIARALYKDAPFIVLDEPTAALDPIAEVEIYSKFDEIAGDKTAIYISQRLSSCKFCDEILVFHKGAVIQQGTHEELVADAQGKYYELWHAQA